MVGADLEKDSTCLPAHPLEPAPYLQRLHRKSEGQNEAEASHPAHEQMTLIIGFRSKRKGLYQDSPSDHAGDAVDRYQLTCRLFPTGELVAI